MVAKLFLYIATLPLALLIVALGQNKVCQCAFVHLDVPLQFRLGSTIYCHRALMPHNVEPFKIEKVQLTTTLLRLAWSVCQDITFIVICL